MAAAVHVTVLPVPPTMIVAEPTNPPPVLLVIPPVQVRVSPEAFWFRVIIPAPDVVNSPAFDHVAPALFKVMILFVATLMVNVPGNVTAPAVSVAASVIINPPVVA